MVPLTHPLFAILVVLRGILVSLGMDSQSIDSTIDTLSTQSKDSILDTIVSLKDALGASSNPPSQPSHNFVIREGRETPNSNPDPPSGKGKEPLIRNQRKNKRPHSNILEGPGGTSTISAHTPPILVTPPISTPPPTFASQTPLPNPPVTTPLPNPPIIGGDCSASSTSNTTIGEVGISITIDRGRVEANRGGEAFYRQMRQLVGVYLPDIHKFWK